MLISFWIPSMEQKFYPFGNMFMWLHLFMLFGWFFFYCIYVLRYYRQYFIMEYNSFIIKFIEQHGLLLYLLVIIVIIVLIFHVVPYFLPDHSVNDLDLIFAKVLRKCIRSWSIHALLLEIPFSMKTMIIRTTSKWQWWHIVGTFPCQIPTGTVSRTIS